MTLYMLGSVAFEIAPLNATEMERTGDFPFAKHDVLGAAPLYENMGEGAISRTLRGATFPNNDVFDGGLAALNALESARRAGTPQHLLRGDGVVLGWFLIDRISENGKMLSWDGVPSEMSFDITLTLAEAPTAADFFSIFG